MQTIAASEINQKQIAGLDGLRAISVIGIVLYHMFPHAIKGGFLGVSLFFVLSGYLMSITSQNAWKQRKFNLLGFYKRRILRIYLSLIITVCATTLFLKILVPSAIRGIRNEVFSIFGGYNNWWQIAQNASYFTKVNNLSPFTHLWSLAIELQFYLAWPFLFLVFTAVSNKGYGRKAIRFILFLAVCSILFLLLLYKSGQDPSRVYCGTDTRLFSLLLGSALGLCQNQHRKKLIKKRSQCLMLFLILLLVIGTLFVFTDGQSAVTYRMILPVTSFLFLGLISLVSISELPFGQWLDCAPLSWIGKRSYEIYLCQYSILFFFQQWNQGKNSLMAMVLELIIVLVLSSWMYSFSLKFRQREKGLKNEKTQIQNSRNSIRNVSEYDSNRGYLCHSNGSD